MRDGKFHTFTNMGQNRKQIEKNERESNDFVLPPALTLFGGKGDDVLNEPLTKTE